MWFLFGLVTFAAAFVAHLVWRSQSRWKGAEHESGGLQYEIERVRDRRRGGGAGKVKRVRIGIRNAPASFHFDLRPERAYDRWSRALRLTAERQFNDPGFDQAVYVESDDDVLARVIAMNAPLRDAVRKAFSGSSSKAGGYALERFRCRNGRLWCELAPVGPDSSPGAAAAAKLVPVLHELRAQLADAAPMRTTLRDPFVARAIAVLSVSTASAVLGAVFLLRAMAGRTDLLDPGGLFSLTWLPSLVLLAAFAIVALRALGGSARAHLVLFEVLTVGGFGFLSGGFALAREANMDFDTAPAQVQRLDDITTEHRITRGRRRTSHHYYLDTPAWPPGVDGPSQIEIDRRLFNRLVPGTSANVMIRPGALGQPWVESVAPARGLE